MNQERLKRDAWIEETSKVLQDEPYKWNEQEADDYAYELATSYFDEEYLDPASAVAEDASYWD